MIEGVVYKPALLASAQIRILDRKLGVDSEVTRTAVVASPEKRGTVRWEDYVANGKSLDNVDTTPAPSVKFGSIDAPLNDCKIDDRPAKRFRRLDVPQFVSHCAGEPGIESVLRV